MAPVCVLVINCKHICKLPTLDSPQEVSGGELDHLADLLLAQSEGDCLEAAREVALCGEVLGQQHGLYLLAQLGGRRPGRCGGLC
jgi:hypothetical protein